MIQSMINATVSHEIRNPVNAIHSQNVILDMLIKKVGDLVEYVGLSQLSIEDFMSKLQVILKEADEALGISRQSERLVSLLVEDYTDMGLM